MFAFISEIMCATSKTNNNIYFSVKNSMTCGFEWSIFEYEFTDFCLNCSSCNNLIVCYSYIFCFFKITVLNKNDTVFYFESTIEILDPIQSSRLFSS